MKPSFDCTLYLIADSSLIPPQKLPDAAAEAIRGGVTLIQLRAKTLSDDEFLQLAKRIKKVTDTFSLPLILNDRIHLVKAVGAAGVHIGQHDLPVPSAREKLGPNGILGVSVTTAKEARLAAAQGADYLGVGAMFPTDTKKDAVLVSFEELVRIRRAAALPMVVIGGIHAQNAPLFGPMGVNGLAVSSAILKAADRTEAAAELRQQFLSGRETK